MLRSTVARPAPGSAATAAVAEQAPVATQASAATAGGAKASTAEPGGAGGASANAERPLIVLFDPQYNPKWDCDPNNLDVESFFKEAGVTEENARVLRGRFDKFCTQAAQGEAYLTPEDFGRFNGHYKICALEDEEHYFRVMDSGRAGKLHFQDFLAGCSAANPTTPHILNSLTGRMRARYIFDFYNSSRSGTLDFEELSRLLTDAKQHLHVPLEQQRRQIQEVAQELGEVSVVTLRVSGMNGPLCDVRASTRWTGLRVRREIARQLQVPIEGQELLIGDEYFTMDMVLGDMVREGATSVAVSMLRTIWEMWPYKVEPCLSDSILGLERLIHVPFDSFYKAIMAEQLRGTSRLFRFRKQILQFSEAQKAKAKSRRSAGAGAAVGGA